MHRFKVNSLQKLLIHINFLLAFSVLFCSHSAFGQSANPAFGGFTTSESKGNNTIITIVNKQHIIIQVKFNIFIYRLFDK